MRCCAAAASGNGRSGQSTPAVVSLSRPVSFSIWLTLRLQDAVASQIVRDLYIKPRLLSGSVEIKWCGPPPLAGRRAQPPIRAPTRPLMVTRFARRGSDPAVTVRVSTRADDHEADDAGAGLRHDVLQDSSPLADGLRRFCLVRRRISRGAKRWRHADTRQG